MAGEVKFRGLEKVLRNLNKEVRKIEGATVAGLAVAGAAVKRDAVKNAPLVTGNLRASSFLTFPGGSDVGAGREGGKEQGDTKARQERVVSVSKSRVEKASKTTKPFVEVGFAAIYAMAVHENPRAGRTGGVSPSGRKYTAGRTTSGRRSNRKVYSTVGGWKFLERALEDNKSKILNIIRRRAKK